MRLTRSQSLLIAVGTLVLFFAVVYVIVGQDQRQVPKLSDGERARIAMESQGGSANTEPVMPSRDHQPPKPRGSDSESLFVLNNFERSEIKDGRKTWEVKAAQGEYFPSTASAKVEQAIMWVYQKDGEVVRLEADRAWLSLQGTALVKVEALGNVKLTKNEELVVTTEKAVFDREANLVIAPGDVAISGKSINVKGKAMTVNLDSEEVRLDSDVHTVIEAKEPERAE